MGNYVIGVGNYVIANPSKLGNYLSADIHPLLLAWAGHCIHLREVTTADVITATGLLPGAAGAVRPSPPCAHCSATPRRPARSSATPPAASTTASVP